MPEPNVFAAGEADVHDVRELLREYAAALTFPLDFQGFDRELAELPGAYAPPKGALLVARADGAAAGCVALRPLDETTCELKRLYVRRAHRGRGVGRLLVASILEEARRQGYRVMRLDTVPGMEAAQALYEQLGFREIAPYTDNPVEGTRFLELELDPWI
ncbi:MAG: GNAT family N-acetyltransferase [Actinomycetota bacterium]|nr:GNAT family N-acetyltransferase [Actinomycetota bacterium]